MTFTFEDAKAVCSRLRDRDKDRTRDLADLLATCLDVGSRVKGIEDAIDAQVDEEEFSGEIAYTALGDLAKTIAQSKYLGLGMEMQLRKNYEIYIH